MVEPDQELIMVSLNRKQWDGILYCVHREVQNTRKRKRRPSEMVMEIHHWQSLQAEVTRQVLLNSEALASMRKMHHAGTDENSGTET